MYGSNKWYGDKSQGQVFAYNNGNNNDTATFSSGNGTGNPAGQGIFVGDAGDSITFTGGLWTAVGLTTDSKTGISGMEFKNDKGDDILVSGNVKLAGDFSGTSDTVPVGAGKTSSGNNPPAVVGDAKGSAGQISHNGQWEAITGGNSSSTLTLEQARTASDKPNLSAETKTALKNIVTNWKAMGFKDEQQVTLQDMQNYGDGKIVQGGAATNAASYNGQSFGAEVELKGKRDDAFGLGSTTKDMIDRLNWAMDQGGATVNRMYMGTTSTTKADLEGAIKGLEKVKTTQDANNPDQQAQDQRQIDYIRSLINS